jgi:hypothetical protein
MERLYQKSTHDTKIGTMTTGVDQWWQGQLAWLNDQADALHSAGHTYESAAWHHSQMGLNGTWPLLAQRLLDEGWEWPAVLHELGLDRDLGDDGTVEGHRDLIQRLENQAATIKNQVATIEQLQARVSQLQDEVTAARGRSARPHRR